MTGQTSRINTNGTASFEGPINTFRQELERLRRNDVKLEQVQPVNGQLFVRMLPAQKLTTGGITLVNNREDSYGLVLQTSSTKYAVDDMILFRAFAGTILTFPGVREEVEFRLIDSRDVIAKLNRVVGGLEPRDFYFLVDRPGEIQDSEPAIDIASLGEIQGRLEDVDDDCPGEIQGNRPQLDQVSAET